MDTRRSILTPLLAAVLTLFLAVVPSAGAQQDSALDLTVKISRLEQILGQIDEMAAKTNPSSQPPSMILRGMLQGTDWIDSQRPIVIGAELVGGQTVAAALIPFNRPNDDFAAAFNAKTAPDHYIVSLPPGRPLALSDAALASLVSASGIPSASALFFEVSAKQLLKKAEPTIRQRIAAVEIPPQRGTAGPDITTKDVRSMIEAMLNLGRQVETFSVGLDLQAEQFRFVAETQAAAGSEMAALFSSGASIARLGEIGDEHQIRIKTLAYDLKGAVDLFADVFGPLYQKIGIDFGGLTEMAGNFTGEAVGGMSYGTDGVQFEMIAVLEDAAAKTNFLDDVYLPWMETYSRLLAATYADILGTDIRKVYQRTPDSTVSGIRVAGGRHWQPMPPADPYSAGEPTMITTDVRIAQIKELVLFAPNDARMASLIDAAETMAPSPAGQSPQMRVRIDLAAYFQGLMSLMPELGKPSVQIPNAASMETAVTFAANRAIARTTMNTAGFADLVAAAQAARPAVPVGVASGERAAAEPAKPSPQLPPEKDPDYWYERGALAATYGADRYAVKYFEKVIALDPSRSDAWFEMGVSYGELRWFDKAVQAVDRAIELRPDSGLYYYGRGRIYLMLGAEGQAMDDFQRAAELGSDDAQRYLQRRKENTSI
ncbi:MAG: tetratricopeptide repeat protein [Desulfobacterales bacterium]|jgi:hypothetical protein